MREGHASRTAQHNALFRALESSLPASRRHIEDPLARWFLDRPFALVARLARLPGPRDWVPWYIDTRWPGVRPAVVSRTRFIDEVISAWLAEGVEQLAVLGAGFDSRAYRLPGLRDVRVFEVDHPDTQATKRRALARALPRIPENVCFVAVDFERSDLGACMAAAGYRDSARSILLWEGVTNYLTGASVDATLRWCARSAPGSRLLFTYIHREVLTRPRAFAGAERLFAALARVGERFTFGIEPSELPAFLADRGMTLESDVGCAEFRARCYGEAARGMRGHEFYRVAQARIG